MVMQEILSELKMTPGVVGGFFFHRKNGVLYQDMTSEHENLNGNDIGRQLNKIYAARRLNFPDVQDINLYFAEAVIVSRAIDDQFILILLCDQDANSSSLSVSLRLAIEEHSEELALAATGQLAEGASTGAQQLSPQEALKGPLKEPLERIQGILVDLMGPMAELVYEESLEQWMGAGRIGVDQLPDFVELIAGELPDIQKAMTFKDRCRNLM